MMKEMHIRKWLNKKKSLVYSGYIMWGIYPPKEKDKHPYTDAYLKIADCSRHIDLALDTNNESIDNTIQKLNCIVEEVTKLKVNLLLAYEMQFKLEKEKAEKENKKK